MSDISRARSALLKRILEGPGNASHSDRRASFNLSGIAGPIDALVEKIARAAHSVTDEDIDSARESGFSDDQIFEIVVCAAVGQADRQYNAALAALVAATEKD